MLAFRGATAWEFAVGRLSFRIAYPKYWNMVKFYWEKKEKKTTKIIFVVINEETDKIERVCGSIEAAQQFIETATRKTEGIVDFKIDEWMVEFKE